MLFDLHRSKGPNIFIINIFFLLHRTCSWWRITTHLLSMMQVLWCLMSGTFLAEDLSNFMDFKLILSSSFCFQSLLCRCILHFCSIVIKILVLDYTAIIKFVLSSLCSCYYSLVHLPNMNNELSEIH